MILKQPNGLYARFSTVVDTFTHINMTIEDYAKYIEEKSKCTPEAAMAEAKDVIDNHTHPIEWAIEQWTDLNDSFEEFSEELKEAGYPVLTIYSKDRCPQCEMTKKWCTDKKLPFIIINTDGKSEILTYLKSLDYRSLPVVIDLKFDESFSGFRPDELKKMALARNLKIKK